MAVRGSYKGPKGSRYHTNQERLNQMKLKVLITIALVAVASVASGQVVYDSVRVKVAPGVTCPSGWTASEETITVEALYIVRVPASIGRGCQLQRGVGVPLRV